MFKRWIVPAAVLIFCLALPVFAIAEEPEMDPLLELLVEQGVITAEQARAVQAEYDRRQGAESSPKDPATGEPAPQTATAEPAPAPESSKKKDMWYDRIDVKGDVRLRYEGFWVDGLSDNDHRSRLRLRVRPGLYTDITDWMDVGVQLRSGDPSDPVSDNQSLDGGFSMKDIAITEAFVGFDAADWLYVRAGKFDPKKLWKVSDMQWDDDVTVEGALQKASFGAFTSSTYQYFLEERKGGEDSLLFGGQLHGAFDFGSKHTLTVGGGYDQWVNPQYVADLTLDGKLKGNKVTNLLDAEQMLISDFEIGTLFAEWKYKASKRWPIKFTAFAYHNFGADGPGKDHDDGYFLRLQVGDYKKKGQLALRLSRYYSEPDALFYVFTQSDTTMGSDVDGYRFDLRLGWVMKSYFNVTWYHTKPASELVDRPTMNRLQIDYIIRF